MKRVNKKVRASEQKRALRVRRKVRRGTAVRPRMCVVKSNKHLQVQLIDDVRGHTIAMVSTSMKIMQEQKLGQKSKDSAKYMGTMIAEQAQKLGISHVIFDRGPFTYHGVLATLADAAREKGLQF